MALERAKGKDVILAYDEKSAQSRRQVLGKIIPPGPEPPGVPTVNRRGRFHNISMIKTYRNVKR
jgi:hypothetical protein